MWKYVFSFLTLAFSVQPTLAQGLVAEWELRQSLTAIVDQMNRLTPLLEQISPEEWIPKGAPATYVEQWKSVRSQLGFVSRNAEELAKDPERLTKVLELYLRLQSIESTVGALAGGIRNYQNPAAADLVEAVLAESGTHRGGLRNYLVDLAAAKETELKIMDAEAQRCRSQIIRTPPAQKKAAPKQ